MHVVLVAEAWTSGQQIAFDQECSTLWDALLDIPPFNLLHRHPDAIDIWSVFAPSGQEGPSLSGAPGDTVAGSTYDVGTHRLSLSPQRVADVLNASSLPTKPQPTPVGVLASDVFGWGTGSAVVCFLVPPVADGTAVSGEFDSYLPFPGPSWQAARPRWIACTTDDGWQIVVARQLSHAWGLGDEWADDAAEFGSASDPSFEIAAASYPNLLRGPAPTGVPTEDFKWYAELDAATRVRPLDIVAPGERSAAPIALYEGGGWFRTGIFRSTADCFMTRRIGDLARSPRTVVPEFCTLCRRALSMAIGGTRGRVSRVPLDRQRLVFDEVTTWSQVESHRGTIPTVLDLTGAPPGPDPYWSFHVQIGADVGGLQIQDLQLQRLPADTLAYPTVATRVDLRDICVELDDGTQVSFDLAAAFASTTSPPILLIGTDGMVTPTEPRVMRALKLSLTDDLGGRCPVQVELSFSARQPYADIDPAGSILAAKFYPQIAVRWRPGGVVGVKRMRAAIRVLANNVANTESMEGHGGMAMARTVASFFVDGNTTLNLVHRRLSMLKSNPVPPALGFPMWNLIFDYHKPDVQQDTEVSAVVGPRVGLDRRAKRVATVPWPPDDTTVLMTQRFPDQGSYDNVHVHGNMGNDPLDPRTPQHTTVHAPGCAEACLHWHWRWGWLGSPGAIMNGNSNLPFRGWSRPSRPGRSSERNESWATPLIPPNQDLHVAVTNPDTTRTSPWNDVVTSSLPLDGEKKALWWTADVTDPASDAWQVVGESAISFAYQYNWACSLIHTNLAWLRALTSLRDSPTRRTDLQVLDTQYSFIRWYVDENFKATAEQIPEGTVIGSTGVPLEQL